MTDMKVPPIRMDQSMSIAAVMVVNLIGTFGNPGDSEEELGTLHLICLSVFLYQLLNSAKQKEKSGRDTGGSYRRVAQPPTELAP